LLAQGDPHAQFARIRQRCLRTSDLERPKIFDHTWDEFKPCFTELEAVVTDNYSDGSDPVLCVRDEDGCNWTIELASHARNAEIGLKASAALPGDPIRISAAAPAISANSASRPCI